MSPSALKLVVVSGAEQPVSAPLVVLEVVTAAVVAAITVVVVVVVDGWCLASRQFGVGWNMPNTSDLLLG